jgi:hypothetical protein
VTRALRATVTAAAVVLAWTAGITLWVALCAYLIAMCTPAGAAVLLGLCWWGAGVGRRHHVLAGESA